LWTLLLLTPLVLLLLWRAGVLTPAIAVQLVTVSRIHPSQSLTLLNASGYVVAQRKAAVASEITGRLVWLGVEEGSAVQKGEVIARLESRQAEAAEAQAAANLATARARVTEARAEWKEAKQDFERMSELLAAGFVSPAEFDRAEARYRRAEAGERAAETAVTATEAALRQATVGLDYTRLRAPFDAVVLTKNADIGDIVTPLGAAAEAKAAVVNIADLDSLQVEADVSESNLSAIKVGQPVEIQLDALPDERFAGEVHMIVPTADRTKATVLVKVRFLEKDPRILPEMSARVAFLRRPLKEAEMQPRTAIPASALVARGGEKVVFRVPEATARATAVVTGMDMGEMVEIVRGVAAGDKVVLAPPPELDAGERVKIVE
ncbi:MAG: efflux RND transporter periplasmic adaptor subunit, partial [Desulfuromonadales bacterium]